MSVNSTTILLHNPIISRLSSETLKNKHAIKILEGLIAKGFPKTNCSVITQLTIQNCRLCKLLGRDEPSIILDVVSVEDAGLVLGLRQQQGHKMLYSWDRVISIS